MKTYHSVAEIEHDAKGHFFDAPTMRSFCSRVLDGVYGGCYFITSERAPDEPRTYTIRRITEDRTIVTVGEYGAYKTPDAARKAIKELLKQQGA